MAHSQARLTLYFAEKGTELLRTEFAGPDGKRHFAVRSKNEPIDSRSGTFEWRSGLKALTILLLRTAAHGMRKDSRSHPVLLGVEKSAANSLDSVLPLNNPEKVPAWAKAMFGVISPQNRPRLPEMLRRENTGRKLKHVPVSVALDIECLSAASILVFKGESQIQNPEDLDRMAEEIERSETSWVPSRVAWQDDSGSSPITGVPSELKKSQLSHTARIAIAAQLQDRAKGIDSLIEILCELAHPRNYAELTKKSLLAFDAVLRQDALRRRTEKGALVASIEQIATAFLDAVGVSDFAVKPLFDACIAELEDDPWWIGSFGKEELFIRDSKTASLDPLRFVKFARLRGDLVGVVYVVREAYAARVVADGRDEFFSAIRSLSRSDSEAFYQRWAATLGEDVDWTRVREDYVNVFRILQFRFRSTFPYER